MPEYKHARCTHHANDHRSFSYQATSFTPTPPPLINTQSLSCQHFIQPRIRISITHTTFQKSSKVKEPRYNLVSIGRQHKRDENETKNKIAVDLTNLSSTLSSLYLCSFHQSLSDFVSTSIGEGLNFNQVNKYTVRTSIKTSYNSTESQCSSFKELAKTCCYCCFFTQLCKVLYQFHFSFYVFFLSF